MDRWIGGFVSCNEDPVVVKRKLSWKEKLSVYCSIFAPTQRMRSWIQATEISFLQKVTGLSLRDRRRSSTSPRELGVEPLLLHIERSQLRRSYG